MSTKNYIVASILGLTLITSCTPTKMGENNTDSYRSVKEISNDVSIKNHIKAHLIQNNMSLVGVKVTEGRVLLNGKVNNARDKLEAAKIAWNQVGVREVNNSIIITDKTERSFSQVTTDSRITSEIKSKLLISKDIKSMNYGFETIDGVVYILGTAQSQSEYDAVINIVNTVKDVKKIESYVRIKS